VTIDSMVAIKDNLASSIPRIAPLLPSNLSTCNELLVAFLSESTDYPLSIDSRLLVAVEIACIDLH
jgi:hypothetical protein